MIASMREREIKGAHKFLRRSAFPLSSNSPLSRERCFAEYERVSERIAHRSRHCLYSNSTVQGTPAPEQASDFKRAVKSRNAVCRMYNGCLLAYIDWDSSKLASLVLYGRAAVSFFDFIPNLLELIQWLYYYFIYTCVWRVIFLNSDSWIKFCANLCEY